MKFSHKALLVVIAIILIFALAACGPKVDPNQPPPGSDSLQPSDIIKLADLANYALSANHYSPAAVTYSNTQTEETKLDSRIAENRDDPDYDDLSSVVKIFANSDGSEIIEAMRLAALPHGKMTQVVDYLAGETDVTGAQIDTKVESGEKPQTPGWSFFDDYDYYEKLQDEADENPSDAADDNVKRQYRNMAGKIFKIGMTGDEFARVFIYEMLYAIKVVESDKMAGASFNADPTDKANDAFWNYCKTDLDYDLLVSFLSFADYYKNGSEIARSVRLYGYYYDYEKRAYEETNDEEFEKQLKYGHMTVFTNAEWAEYVLIQRDSYQNSYRYSDEFYEKSFYPVHLAFQEGKETRENQVYDIKQHSNLSYTSEMRSGMSNGGFSGQLKMSDWLWCYGGDAAKMNAYNEANTQYENGKNQGSENAARGEYYYNREQLKIANYLLTKMTNTELGNALRYQIYNYSSDMVSGIQNHKKDNVLLSVDKIAPGQYIYDKGYVASSNLAGAKIYSEGKTNAIIDQMAKSHSDADVTTKAAKASTESWATMNKEVETALDETNYAQIPTFAGKDGKLQRLEDLVIKRIYQPCGLDMNEEGCDHYDCTKEYDTSHSISQFASNYATILQRVSGSTVLTFKTPTKNYNLPAEPQTKTYAPKYYNGGHSEINKDMAVRGINDFKEYEEITIEMGAEFKQGILDAAIDTDDQIASGTTEGQNWWNKYSRPVKATETVEVMVGRDKAYYEHKYTFVGWYLDDTLLYKIEDTDEINCDLVLYAGYSVVRTQK